MWLVFALISALIKGIGNYYNKLGADRVDGAVLTMASRFVGVSGALVAFVILDDRSSSFTSQFFVAITVAGSLTAFSTVLRFKAFSEGQVSHLIPLGNLIPVISMLLALFILNERPSIQGALGVGIVAIGAYVLHMQKHHLQWHQPLTDIYKLPASRKMMIVVIILSISLNFDKIGLEYVSPYMWVIGIGLMQFLWTLPLALKNPSLAHKQIREHWKIIAAIGTLSFSAFLFQLLSFEAGGLLGYTIAIKRLDTLVTILLAGYFLKEDDIRKRLFGGAIMAVGAVIIALS